jgi:hypothetical protein
MNKWTLTAAGLTIGVAAATLLVAAKAHRTYLSAVIGPVCLWWLSMGIAVALNVGLSRPGLWPRGRRAISVAVASAVVVGGWIGGTGAPWSVLAILPLYCVVERLLACRLLPSDEIGVYVPLPIWLGYVVSGQMLGYLLGLCAAEVVRIAANHG